MLPVLLFEARLVVSVFSSNIGPVSDPALSVGLAAMTPPLPADTGLVGDISLADASEPRSDCGMHVGSETAVLDAPEKQSFKGFFRAIVAEDTMYGTVERKRERKKKELQRP